MSYNIYIFKYRIGGDLLRRKPFETQIADVYSRTRDLEVLYYKLSTSPFLDRIGEYEKLIEHTTDEHFITIEEKQRILLKPLRNIYGEVISIYIYIYLLASRNSFQYSSIFLREI